MGHIDEGSSSNVTMDSTWAEQNEDAIVDSLAKILEVSREQINVVSISPIGGVRRRLKAIEKQANGFRIYFTVDVLEEQVIEEVKNVVNNFVQADSGVHERFVEELKSELENRNTPVPAALSTLLPLSAKSEVWLRASASYFQKSALLSASWIVGAWGSCLGHCGTGIQNRTVVCSNEDVTICGFTNAKPPTFQECKHPTPCPTTETCEFGPNGCSLQWWIVAVAFPVFMLTCVCACLRNRGCKLRRTRVKKEGTTKMAGKTPPVDIHAFVTMCSADPGGHSQNTEVHTKSAETQGEAPTLLRSFSREQMKNLASTIPDPIVRLSAADIKSGDSGKEVLSVADIELGHAGKAACDSESGGAVIEKLDLNPLLKFDNWLMSCDTANMKIPVVAANRER